MSFNVCSVVEDCPSYHSILVDFHFVKDIDISSQFLIIFNRECSLLSYRQKRLLIYAYPKSTIMAETIMLLVK